MTWNGSAQTHLEARGGHVVRWLFWAEVKNRSTGATVDLGMWTGDEDEALTVESESRLYRGLQNHLVPPVLRYATGTEIRRQVVQILGISDEAQDLINTYNPRFAPAQIHCALYDGDMNLLDIRRRFDGIIDSVNLNAPRINGVSQARITLVSAARRGTATISAKKSDQMQRQRDPLDRFRKYGSLGRVSSDWWGPRGKD